MTESLTGANGPVKLAVAGRTIGKVSVPANAVSDFAVGSTNAWGISSNVLTSDMYTLSASSTATLR